MSDHPGKLSESLAGQALRELRGTVCAVCERPKASGEAFCYECFSALPPGKRLAVANATFRDGFVIAYDEAKDFLMLETDRGK